jgi:lipopolysaccharide export system protein LptC
MSDKLGDKQGGHLGSHAGGFWVDGKSDHKLDYKGEPPRGLSSDPLSELTPDPLSALPDQAAPAAATGSRWWLVLERAQATLPLLAAAGLAGFTWWLVQSSPKEDGPARAAQASSAPDYQLQSARVARFDAEGRVVAVLDGRAMRHYPDTERLEVDQLVLTARGETGRRLHAQSREGEADQRTEVVTLRGDAHVVAYPPEGADQGSGLRGGPVRFAGEGLRIDTRARVVSSTQPLTLTQQHSVVHAQSMVYNDHTGVADLGGRVKGRMAVPGSSVAGTEAGQGATP